MSEVARQDVGALQELLALPAGRQPDARLGAQLQRWQSRCEDSTSDPWQYLIGLLIFLGAIGIQLTRYCGG